MVGGLITCGHEADRVVLCGHVSPRLPVKKSTDVQLVEWLQYDHITSLSGLNSLVFVFFSSLLISFCVPGGFCLLIHMLAFSCVTHI